MQGDKRPIPFVEDTAVPPENLADYIAEFRARPRCARAGLRHVRSRRCRRAARPPGHRHEGPGAGEAHPRGDRGGRRASPGSITACCGASTARACARSSRPPSSARSTRRCRRSRPRSIHATSSIPARSPRPRTAQLLTIDGLPTRGQLDRTIPAAVRAGYDEAMHCNGNGACYNYDPDDAMCPSWKATRERRHSPKGRASLTREWLRQLAAAGLRSGGREPARCAGARLAHACPPESATRSASAGARRISRTRSRRRWTAASPASPAPASARSRSTCRASARNSWSSITGATCVPPRDYVVGSIEHLLPLLARMPGCTTRWSASGPGRAGLRASVFAKSRSYPAWISGASLRRAGMAEATPAALRALSTDERARSVVVVQDAFTSYYETPLVLDLLDLIRALGFRPWLAPFRPNGKPLHVHGFLGAVRARGRARMPRCCATWLRRALNWSASIRR